MITELPSVVELKGRETDISEANAIEYLPPNPEPSLVRNTNNKTVLLKVSSNMKKILGFRRHYRKNCVRYADDVFAVINERILNEEQCFLLRTLKRVLAGWDSRARLL
ncbi:hypothetical protein J6590_072311 [Homalodisca vitripennis]|nr:hypothetical protein J6590_072311 [Homalodisca vitripennis]